MMVVFEVDPNLVRPGWTPLVVVVLLGIALFFLGRSMMKQFRKIDVPADHDPNATTDTDEAGGVDAPEPGPSERGNPPIPDLRARTPEAGGSTKPPDRH
jgi:hypothetical protein